MSEHHPLDNMPPSGLDRARARVEFRIDPKIKAVTEELDAINGGLARLRADSLPKVLQIKVGKREYTSIRRVEGTRISKREMPSETPFFHIIEYKVRADLVGEGEVGVLLVPWTLGAEPKGRDLIEFLESQGDVESHESWTSLLPMSIDRGRAFKLNEWKLGSSLSATVKRVEGELYTTTMPLVYVYTREKGRAIAIARRINPDQEGKITMLRNSYWWTKEEIAVQRQLDEKFAAFYVLVEGKSEQERQKEPGGAKRLEPRLSEVIS